MSPAGDTAARPVDWTRVAGVPPLPAGEIHLWWQDLRNPQFELDALRELLSERERQRVARFRVEDAAREFTAARGLLKLLLSGYLDIAPDRLAFRYGPLGKPSLPAIEGTDELCFNYTDSEGFALYAFAWNRELGVDLEMLSRQVRFRRIIQRRFAPRESRALLAMPEEAQRRSFLACWTRKEGYGKALGLGIRFPLDCREMCVDCAATPLTVEDHVDGDAWDIHQLYPTENFVAALVHPSGEYPWRCFSLTEGSRDG